MDVNTTALAVALRKTKPKPEDRPGFDLEQWEGRLELEQWEKDVRAVCAGLRLCSSRFDWNGWLMSCGIPLKPRRRR